MPNGIERYLFNTARTVAYFNAKFGHWPTRLRLGPPLYSLLQHTLLTPSGFSKLATTLQLVPDPSVGIVAEDDDGHTWDIGDPTDDLSVPNPIDAGLDWFGISQEDIVRQP